jgi:exoribonuclease R
MEIVGVLILQSKVRHGFTARGVPLYMFYPYMESQSPMLCSYKGTERKNMCALAVIEHKDLTIPRGGIRRILGEAGIWDIERQALLWQYAPLRWKDELACIEPSRSDRYRITAPTINIDPEGCRDIDDVWSLWSEEDGIWHVAITIADVASYVALNPWLQKAEQIGQTLYDNGRAVAPLFPPHLSEDLFSLRPGQERFGVSLFAIWDGTALRDFVWKKTLVTTTTSYSYENCVEGDMSVLAAIARSILPEAGEDPHKWIEALMILYNTEAAKVLLQAGSGLLRTHSQPEAEALERFTRLGLPAKELAYPAAQYTAIEPDRSEYLHWGLARSAYSHASSPIRRFADVLNQARILACIEGQTVVDKDLSAQALSLAALEKNAKRYERDRVFVDAFFGNETHTVEGVFVETTDTHSTWYLPTWKKFVRAKPFQGDPGTRATLAYFAFLGERSWKKRMVFELQAQI